MGSRGEGLGPRDRKCEFTLSLFGMGLAYADGWIMGNWVRIILTNFIMYGAFRWLWEFGWVMVGLWR